MIRRSSSERNAIFERGSQELRVDGANPRAVSLRGRLAAYSPCGPVARGRVGNRDNAMEASVSSSSSVLSTKIPKTLSGVYCCSGSKATVHFPLRRRCENTSVQNARRTRRTRPIAAINHVQTVLDPAPVQVTWQIVVGAIAGVMPFVVAGVEFSKRIIAQKRCEECGGSGLVLMEKEYFRCPECGGFLPWQSWKRFFSG